MCCKRLICAMKGEYDAVGGEYGAIGGDICRETRVWLS